LGRRFLTLISPSPPTLVAKVGIRQIFKKLDIRVCGYLGKLRKLMMDETIGLEDKKKL